MQRKSSDAGTGGARPAAITRLSIILALAFFLAWCAGTALGVLWSPPPLLWGMPLWFVLSCLLSFAGVSIALVHGIRKCLQ